MGRELVLLFFLRNDFFSVVVSAVLANSMRNFLLVAMRAFNELCSRCLVVCESLIRSALRLFRLRYCHFYSTSFFVFLLLAPFERDAILSANESTRKREHNGIAKTIVKVDHAAKIAVIFALAIARNEIRVYLARKGLLRLL